MSDVYGEAYFVEIIFTNGWLRWLRAWVENTDYRLETYLPPVKKKFLEQRSVKKVILTVFWNMKEPITLDFLEKKVATINKAFYCLFLRTPLPHTHTLISEIFSFLIRKRFRQCVGFLFRFATLEILNLGKCSWRKLSDNLHVTDKNKISIESLKNNSACDF